jgi:RsiW-degrading membrane proteinase PrsW (M82 family)
VIQLVAAAEAGLGAGTLGLVPVLVWLGFWLFEDLKHPEPRKRLLVAFLTGAVAVVAVLPLQKFASDFMPIGLGLLITWAFIEEAMKFGLAWIFILRHRSVDEPIDMAIYMITVALGFASVENSLFLFSPLFAGHISETLVTTDLRFIGATLIHVLGSALVGIFLSFSFFRSRGQQMWYAWIGVILATILHAFFNFLIITTGAEEILTIFLGVWVGIILILLAFERIKLLHPPAWWEKVFTSNG